MAVREYLVDDLDESEGAKTLEFGVDGRYFLIDLNDKNAAKLRKALEPFIKVARPITPASTPRSSKSPKRAPATRRSTPANLPGSTVQKQAIRDWARANGKKVSSVGRIPKDVEAAFHKAHSKNSASPAFSG